MTLDLFAPAVELAAAVRRKEISSLELTRAYIVERDEPVPHVADLAVSFCLDGLRA